MSEQSEVARMKVLAEEGWSLHSEILDHVLAQHRALEAARALLPRVYEMGYRRIPEVDMDDDSNVDADYILWDNLWFETVSMLLAVERGKKRDQRLAARSGPTKACPICGGSGEYTPGAGYDEMRRHLRAEDVMKSGGRRGRIQQAHEAGQEATDDKRD